MQVHWPDDFYLIDLGWQMQGVCSAHFRGPDLPQFPIPRYVYIVRTGATWQEAIDKAVADYPAHVEQEWLAHLAHIEKHKQLAVQYQSDKARANDILRSLKI